MSEVIALHWFRKGLRLHDNPALVQLCIGRSSRIYPVYILEPGLDKRDIGINRYTHMLETLHDLDSSLRKLGSRLFVLQGDDSLEQLREALIKWKITLLTFESDTEPSSLLLDSKVSSLADSLGVKVSSCCSHTLFDPRHYVARSKVTKIGFTSYSSFCKLFSAMGPVRASLPGPLPGDLPPFPPAEASALGLDSLKTDAYSVPTLQAMRYPKRSTPLKFPGGETEALRRLRMMVIERKEWVATFEKPNTSPNALEPSTTVLSPYLRHGSLSPALFYHELNQAVLGKKSYSQPPVSLHGQLLWREFFYLHGHVTPNFDRMQGNPVVRQIPWDRDAALLQAWKDGRTGYPYIDAIMRQLKAEGWIHHLARHSVACFLTRGDLWQHWEDGAQVFEELLLDYDWALNAGNWQWLSCSNFFYQYFRCYSPVAFGKKTDPEGLYIKRWVPELKHYPVKYLYEPFKAPKSVQIMCQCLIGKDYPFPIVDHEAVSKVNMGRMKEAYAAHNAAGSIGEAAGDAGEGAREDDDGDVAPSIKKEDGGGRKKPRTA